MLGSLNQKEAGYMTGVIDQLHKKEAKHDWHDWLQLQEIGYRTVTIEQLQESV